MGMDKSLGVTLADRQYWTIIFKLQFKNRYLPQKWVFLFRIWYVDRESDKVYETESARLNPPPPPRPLMSATKIDCHVQ